MIKISKLAFAALLTVFMACSKDVVPQATRTIPIVQPQDKGWAFETSTYWSDEFDYTGLPASSKWGYDIGGSGWGNNELQYYTNDLNNASVADGKLIITLRKQDMNGKNYTSARLVSKGKGDFLYGRFEVKAKLPSGKGTWPAIWMLPTDWEYGGWPKSGEIDIMEHVGYDQNRVHVTVHTEAYNHGINTQRGTNKVVANVSNEFHLYRIDWTPYAVKGFIDNEQMFEFINEGKGSPVWPFDKKFHLLLNIAFGGNWGAAQGIDASVLPQTMEIDYVRVYKMVDK